MPESLIIGYGVVFDEAGRVLLLRRRASEALWPGRWWLPGDVTPLSEEPDDTVPRLFEHLLRQRVRAVYAHTVTGPEPSSGRHTVHNAYLVEAQSALDGAPDDETNPFDAMEWWDANAAIAELPVEQSNLLGAVLEKLESGWNFEAESDLDDLFDHAGVEEVDDALRPALAPRLAALIRVALSAASQSDAEAEHCLRAAREHGWSPPELEAALKLGRAASVNRPSA